MDDFRKSYETAIDDIDVKNREVVAVISTDGLDRDGEVLLPKGLRKKNYAGMTIDFNHDKNLPIGVSRWVKSEPNRIISKYRVSDKTEFSRQVFDLLQDKVLRFHSVDGKAFSASKPTTDECRLNKSWDGAKRIIRDWEMYNFTVCTVPVNTEAVAMLVAKGYSTQTIETFSGGHIELPPAPTVEVSPLVRNLTSGEAVVALSKAMGMRTATLNVDRIIARAMARAAGKLD